MYEYWATGKAPVLLISEAGASSALVANNHIGRYFRFDQAEDIANYIEQVFDSYQCGRPAWIERAGIEKYDRRELARRMSDLWMSLLAGA